MRNLYKPGSLKKKKETLYQHVCSGLDGLNSYSAFCSKGLLNIVNQYIDKDAKGFHKDHQFILQTKFTREELLDYLVTHYQPSPFIPVYAKALFQKTFNEVLEEVKDVYPTYYNQVLRNKIVIQSWLDENEYEYTDIKGDVLIDLFHQLKDLINDQGVMDFVRVVGIPYLINKKNGSQIKKIWFSPLFNKTLGRVGKGNIWTSYLLSLRDISRESWEASLFGTPHPVGGTYPTYQFDLKNWGGSREGKVSRGDGYRGIGTESGETSVGTPADTLMLIASLPFFRGFVGEKYSQNINLTTELPNIQKKPVFTLVVRNNAPSFHTGLWSEMSTSNTSQYLLGVEEVFVPMWSEPLTFQQARERLSETAALPIATSINSNRDLMEHLSQHATRTGITSYIRFACVPRGGVGMAKLNFLIPVEEFEPRKSRRNDIVSPFIPLYNECLFKMRKGNLPYSLHQSVSSFISDVNDFSMSRATPKDIMFSFLNIISTLDFQDSNNLSGKLSKKYLNSSNFVLPEWWLGLLERGEPSSELKIAKSISLKKQLCCLDDVLLLLEDKLDVTLINAYIKFLKYLPLPDEDEVSSDGRIWMPADFIASYKFLSYKRYKLEDEKTAYWFMISHGDTLAALSIALDTLYSHNLIKSFIYPFDSTSAENLQLALQIPIGVKDQRRLREQIK